MSILKRLSTLLLPGVMALSLGLSACGGGSSSNPGDPGGDNGGNGNGGDSTTDFTGIEGPLDAVQDPVSNQVLSQLAGAVAGTPLEGTIDCIDEAVVLDLIDVLDAVAVGLQSVALGMDPQAAFEASVQNIQAPLEAFATDLPAVLTSLAGQGCDEEADGVGGGDNPLAGTPLEPLGEALAPVLSQLPSETGEDVDLMSLSAFMTALNAAFQDGLAQVPAEAQEAPVVGGLLNTLSHTLSNLDLTVQAVGAYNSTNATIGLAITLQQLLGDVLTEVVPVKFIEEQAGQGPIVSSQIETGLNQISQAIVAALTPANALVMDELLDGALSPALDPVENSVLPAILGPITDALAGGGDGGATGPTGTPLDALLAPIAGGLSGGGVGGLSGTPLDIILAPLADAINTGGSGACPVAGTPLDALCTVTDGLLDGLPLGDILDMIGLGDLLPL